MTPSMISDVQRTDHGPCANLHVYKPTQIYETVPRLSTCDILLHCSTSYSSAFAQHCTVAYPIPPLSCTRVHPHRLYPPRVSPSDPVSLLQVRPLPTISSESQHPLSQTGFPPPPATFRSLSQWGNLLYNGAIYN